MGKRFVPVRDADKRALELYFALREVEDMPLIDLEVHKDSKTPIIFGDKNDRHKWWSLTVDQFLSRDIAGAKAKGGSASDLCVTFKKPARPRIPQSEVDRSVDGFFSGHDDE
jgi:hypothetical protein